MGAQCQRPCRDAARGLGDVSGEETPAKTNRDGNSLSEAQIRLVQETWG
eukprot:CAMPEP_0117564892 /NCGR_PEP_ID=MMETSP0784-20121206/56281_1 /TAXON_ID=39447 /ORGANISM="" /LENGTH=48 /DNA_ID= /DNA_START= /DNA_END= /DNA_ORIENTATION=